jgi:GAF domain-containing protein
MTATVDNAAADLQRANAEFQRRLDELTAERDEYRDERNEALARETATAEVLQVINSSPGDLAPVFDAMLGKALHLCGAAFGELRTYDGDRFLLAAARGAPAAYIEYFTGRDTGRYGPGTGPARLLAGETVVHIPDLIATEAYRDGDPDRRALVDLGGARAYVHVPLLADRKVRGFIMVYRREAGPFSGKQIGLLQSFAAQAVIAMENARLLTETREALEQQTATAEVLGVINGNPGNLQPVFDAMLERAARLCEADAGHLFRFENGAFFRLASHGVSEDFDRVFPPETPVLLIPRSVPAQMVATRSIMHVRDAREDESYRLRLDRDMVTAVEEAGILTLLFVPLIKEGEVVGHFTIHRMEVKPFSNKQIALLQNFAAQAVIAMENARLLTETREALQQQTATAEVLGVINASPGDLSPVFEAILEKAHSLCSSAQGTLELYDGEYFRAVATRDLPEQFAERLRRGLRSSENFAAQPLVAGEPFAHFTDVAKLDHPLAQETAAFGTRVVADPVLWTQVWVKQLV